MIFHKLKFCGSPASSKSIGAIFPTAFAQFMSLSLCHIFIIYAVVQTFSLLFICYGDLRSVFFDVTIAKR